MRLYFAVSTIALLATHQVDAAYQKEWELFGVPGGIDFFLVFNFVAVFVLLMSLIKLASVPRANFLWRYLIPIMGLFTVTIHSIFMLKGHSEFTQIGSISILVLLLLSSATEVYLENSLSQRIKEYPDTL
ncbi:DUF6713 family protein [Peredibacter starrii]|uniref:DUF6713 family protein n=1 Tax=Peredibacter starrii TaxID=28202 RepID=A0AAX4HNX9_9BACT|nr:DUF6713 family protein [Peredibacter starrii]WPU65035.1 DUF6713 family protein [Peredibacter starrii]